MDSESEHEIEENHESEDEGIKNEEKERIRTELSTMTFEDLQKLKQTIGAKVYNETVFGTNNAKKQTSFKRANKNRPRETSSKRPVKIASDVIAVKKTFPRDPRFDPLCGSYDEKSFKANYGFVNDLKKGEKKELQKELEATEDPERKRKIKLLIQRLDNQIREQEKREQRERKLQAEKEEIREQIKRGEKPIFKRKSERKMEELVEKYEELKKTNSLEKYLEKRSKKQASKEYKKFPHLSVKQ